MFLSNAMGNLGARLFPQGAGMPSVGGQPPGLMGLLAGGGGNMTPSPATFPQTTPATTPPSGPGGLSPALMAALGHLPSFLGGQGAQGMQGGPGGVIAPGLGGIMGRPGGPPPGMAAPSPAAPGMLAGSVLGRALGGAAGQTPTPGPTGGIFGGIGRAITPPMSTMPGVGPALGGGMPGGMPGGMQGGLMAALQGLLRNGPPQSGASPGATTTSIGPMAGAQGSPTGQFNNLLSILKNRTGNQQNQLTPNATPGTSAT